MLCLRLNLARFPQKQSGGKEEQQAMADLGSNASMIISDPAGIYRFVCYARDPGNRSDESLVFTDG